MKLRLLSLLLVVATLGMAQAPPSSPKPLDQEEILELLRNYVPSQRMTALVQQNGINFAPTEDFYKEVRQAGGEDELITALRAAQPKRVVNASPTAGASAVQLKQLLTRAGEARKDKQYPAAEEAYRAALKLAPDRADIHLSLGIVLLEEKRLDAAIQEDREALRLRPEMAAAHNNLGVALYRQGDWAGAKTEYGEALHIRPKYALAHHNLGEALGEDRRDAGGRTRISRRLSA